MKRRKTAGELSKQAAKDPTKYDALEVGHFFAEDINIHLRTCIENHKQIIDENEFCIIMVIAKDPILQNLIRRKFFAWPYLPKPRPNQSVFLYNKGRDKITKRLWVLPSDMVMAELHSLTTVDKRYETMKRWTDYFYHGWRFIKDNPTDPNCKNGKFVNTTPSYFWDKIREENRITMPSEWEFLQANREKLIEAGCKLPAPGDTEPFDFSKIHIKQVVDANEPVVQQ